MLSCCTQSTSCELARTRAVFIFNPRSPSKPMYRCSSCKSPAWHLSLPHPLCEEVPLTHDKWVRKKILFGQKWELDGAASKSSRFSLLLLSASATLSNLQRCLNQCCQGHISMSSSDFSTPRSSCMPLDFSNAIRQRSLVCLTSHQHLSMLFSFSLSAYKI